MKLGLGLSLPGVAAMGGKVAGRTWSRAVFRLDARLNPDQATGAPTDLSSYAASVTSSGGVTWTAGSHWTFNGADGFFQVADADHLDFAGSDPFTIIAVVQVAALLAGSQAVVAKAPAFTNSAGYTLGFGTVAPSAFCRISDGTNNVVGGASAYTLGTVAVLGARRSVAADNLRTILNGTLNAGNTDTTTGTLANSEALRIGRLSGAGANYAAMKLRAVGVWREALTDAEIAAIAASEPTAAI